MSVVDERGEVQQDFLQRVYILLLPIDDEGRVAGLYGDAEQVLQKSDVFIEWAEEELNTAI
jgi:hypothetical protein